MTLFIVEDNPSIRRFLLQVVPTLGDDFTVIGASSSVEEALILLRSQRPDLLLLDVELPDGNGFDVLRRWHEASDTPFTGSVIFATAHDHYALRAIKYSALDYLLKPIDVDELAAALRKAADRQRAQPFLENKIDVLHQNLEHPPTDDATDRQRIVLADAERIYLVTVRDIVRCEADGSYTQFHLASGKHLTLSKSIKTVEQMLPDSLFYRIHRSHLINLTCFDYLDRRDGGTVHLHDGTRLPVAVRRREALLERLQQL